MDNKIHVIKIPSPLESAKLIGWKIKGNQFVNPNTAICTIEASESKQDLLAPGYGVIKRIASVDSHLDKDTPIFEFNPCSHHVVMRDLCAQCGANLRKIGSMNASKQTHLNASIPIVHTIPELHVSEKFATEIGLQDEKYLISSRKLTLLVDLDQTILHTSVEPTCIRFKNLKRYRLAGSPIIYHTKLRPHLEDFLSRISKLYQLHICTFGNRQYAHQLTSIIDPDRKYFSERILSRDECFSLSTKAENLKALFPTGIHMVCIIDDRGEVWNWSPNLIHVQPYKFFPDVDDINGYGLKRSYSSENENLEKKENKPSFTTPEDEEKYLDSQDEDYLIKLENILNKIHRNFYMEYDKRFTQAIRRTENYSDELKFSRSIIPNISDVMSDLRKGILGGSATCVTLSGLVSHPREPNSSLIGKLALNMGAILRTNLYLPPLNDPSSNNTLSDTEKLKREKESPESTLTFSVKSDNDVDRNRQDNENIYTSVLVGCNQKTDKVLQALNYIEKNINPGRPLHIVNPYWIWGCHYCWTKMDPKKYPLDRDYNRNLFNPFSSHSGQSRSIRKRIQRERHFHRMLSKNEKQSENTVTKPEDKIEDLIDENAQQSGSDRIATDSVDPLKEKPCEKPYDSEEIDRSNSESEIVKGKSAGRVIRPSGRSSKFLTEMKVKDKFKRQKLNPKDEPVSQEELSLYLPKSTDNFLVKNPLIHLPPKATSDMLNEIEDALLEEKTALHKTMPPEAELFNVNSSSDSSSDNSSIYSESSQNSSSNKGKRFPKSGHKRHYFDYTSSSDEGIYPNYSMVLDHEGNQPLDLENDDRKATMLLDRKPARRFKATFQNKEGCEEDDEDLTEDGEDSNFDILTKRINLNDKIMNIRRLRLRKDLLLRRRSRTIDQADLVKINQRIWKVQRMMRRINAEIRHYKARGYYRTKQDFSKNLDDSQKTHSRKNSCQERFILDTDDSSRGKHSSEDFWDPEYPKGWNKSGSFTKNRLFVDSPHIHSDPGLIMFSGGEFEREWNTCPEGYDYADAEEIRAFLRSEDLNEESTSSRFRKMKSDSLINLTTVLREDLKPHLNLNESSSSSTTSSSEDRNGSDEDDYVIDDNLFKEYM